MATSMSPTAITFNDGSTQTTAGSSNVNTMSVNTSSGTYTKPSTVKSIKVTVVGGGGAGFPGSLGVGGSGGGTSIKYYPAPSLPGPQPYTVGAAGSTSSFGSVPVGPISATGGSTPPASSALVLGGTGTGGTLNIRGGPPTPVGPAVNGGCGGNSYHGFGGRGANPVSGASAGNNFGGGGGGAIPSSTGAGAGAAGVVIIEEFY